MARRIQPGHYKLGEINEVREGRQGNRRQCTVEYGVVNGETANTAGDSESPSEKSYWGHFCADALYRTKWFVYRVETDPGGSPESVPQLVTRKPDKKAATEWIAENVEDDFVRDY